MEDPMSFHIMIDTGKVTNNHSSYQIAPESGNAGFSNLKKGQLINGTIVSMGDQVTLDFDGQKVSTSKEVLKNATVGESKTFEVVKASDNEIELKLLEESMAGLRKTMKAVMLRESDWETMLAQKNQSAKQTEKETQTAEQKEKLSEISTKFTEKDYHALEKEGFPVETMSLNGLYEAINRVKAAQAEVSGKASDRNQGTGKLTDSVIEARLKAENLPATAQNISNVKKALALSETASRMDDKAVKYLITQDAEPTIENIYKAYYSGSSKRAEQTQPLSEEAWAELNTQVQSVIGAAGYEVNQENMKDARWLIENKLPLTEKTFTYKKELEQLKTNTDQGVILDRIMDGMKQGTVPMEVSLAEDDAGRLQKVIQKVNSISDDAVAYAVTSNSELTLQRLTTIQENLAAGKIKADELEDETPGQQTSGQEATSGKDKDYEYETIKAQRQMEEIRLKMNLEAAGRLEKKGIDVETQELEKVVEELRRLEDSYYSKMLQEADVPVTEDALQILKTTTQSVEQLKYLPSSVLGSTLAERGVQTIPDLLSEGTQLQAQYLKAGSAYETLMTVPNAEYGDSIRKAFANMDSLLTELQIENTEQNQRAVRILGYNQMELTTENINQVKAYDSEVTALISNLHPAVTVRMIKEGINPLHVPIDELNKEIDQMKEEQGITSEDKFSTYLQKLEKENNITAEERKAYIGVYRLLYNVEKSDGAAIGSVIKADREVTLSNLLTAVQTGKKGRMDAVINDEFGTLTELTRNRISISEQLNAFSGSDQEMQDNNPQNQSQGRSEEQGQRQKEMTQEEQAQYLNRVVKQITEEASPNKLSQLQSLVTTADTMHSARDTAAGQARTAGTVSQGVWDTIKDYSLEKLLGQLKNVEETQDTTSEIYTQKLQEFRELSKNCEQSIRFLKDYQMGNSSQNIMMANQVLSSSISPLGKLLKQKSENNSEKSENSLKEIEDLSDNLIDKASMNEAYEALETEAKETLVRACSEETLDSRKLAELKGLGQQLAFLRKLASREFYQIPIETSRGVTNLNLTILRGADTTGKVAVSVRSEQLGEVKAEFSLKDSSLKGFIRCEDRNSLNKLQNNLGVIEKAAEDCGIELKQLDFGIQSRDNDGYPYSNSESGAQEAAVGSDTEQKLYRIAKAIVQMVRSAEDSDADTQRAVS